ncbi:4-hydroxythreonine-4-phosphate dehydrogenase PdxA [Parapusillimonas sp. JC17]|uniref:4-hydroxythreonine-4-phosphate dehydrogenase PdxA n=1 Tax=Parapusillimonas sp. JC17 TaxID=3445768 RepID=UPI003F9EECBE
MRPPSILITMGDPSGVGPEIIAKSLAHLPGDLDILPLVVGDARRLECASRLVDSGLSIHAIKRPEQACHAPRTIECIDVPIVSSNLPFGRISAEGGEAAYQFIIKAVALAQEGHAHAICTAPLNKAALHAAGHIFPGHTELLANLTQTPEVSMLLVAPRLRVIHVTTHIGIMDAVERIEPGIVARTIERGHELLRRRGMSPRIAVCGINPHAGEGGLFGRGEEDTKIAPAIEKCRNMGIDVQGPLPADTLFFRAVRGDFDLVVAMYHDQGHGPVKVLGLEAGVNVTVGLPFVRTSVDHGTAFDIAGKGVADAGSMVEALRLAAELYPRSE